MTYLGPKGLGPLFLMERPLADPEIKAGLLLAHERILRQCHSQFWPARIGKAPVDIEAVHLRALEVTDT